MTTKTEVLENNVAGNQAVRANHNVDAALPKKFENFAFVRRAIETG